MSSWKRSTKLSLTGKRPKTGLNVRVWIRHSKSHLFEFLIDVTSCWESWLSGSWWEIEERRGWVDPFPGLNMRKVNMTAYNHPRETLDRRQLQYYKVIGDMPSIEEDPNLHAIAHLYASDRNGLFPVSFFQLQYGFLCWRRQIPNFLDLGNEYLAIASLSHTVIFHVEALGLRTVQEGGDKPWFVVETAIDKIAHGRALASHRLWREDGLHIASCFQDGMLRMPGPGESIGDDKRVFGDSYTANDEKKPKLWWAKGDLKLGERRAASRRISLPGGNPFLLYAVCSDTCVCV